MTDWLASTWEANWKSFQYFNLYRLVVALVLVVSIHFAIGWFSLSRLPDRTASDWVGVGYASLVGAGFFLSIHWQRRFNAQLTFQAAVDALAVSILMYAIGGVSSGLGVLLFVSLAAASLVGKGRLVLLYAALATVAVLIMQIYGVLNEEFEASSLVQAGMLSSGFFATAVLARLLGQKIMANEELARRRGIALDNQMRISQGVIEHMQSGVLVVARDGSVLRANPVALGMLGGNLHEGKRLADFAPDLGGAFQSWLTRQGRAVMDFSGVGRLQARFEHTESSDGEVLVFIEDVGRIQAQAQQLKLASLGRLTASIAHEIRNPLAAISHAGELLREERRGEIHERLLRILADNTARLDRIVSDVLELGRRTSGVPEPIALAPFVATFVAEFCRNENVAESVFTVDVPPGLSLCFDPAHLRQVVWNLAANAVRYAAAGVGGVRLFARRDHGDGRVELHVWDNGAGVPAASREQIFEPFFTTYHQGTGLGLYISRELAEANGASLVLLDGEGGAHFVLQGRGDRCQLAEPSAGSGGS